MNRLMKLVTILYYAGMSKDVGHRGNSMMRGMPWLSQGEKTPMWICKQRH